MGSEPKQFPNEGEQDGTGTVQGTEVTMGTVSCKADGNTASYTCRLNDLPTWTWRLGKGALDGDMQHRGQLYRTIHLIRAE
jgi:hypothetical protein